MTVSRIGVSLEKDLLDALRKNFEGYPELHSQVKNHLNKYGNDIDEIFPDPINIDRLYPDQRKAVKILIILKYKRSNKFVL